MRTPIEDRSIIRDNTMTIPVSNDEKRQIEETAREKGLTMSGFVRMAVRDAMAKEVTNSD